MITLQAKVHNFPVGTEKTEINISQDSHGYQINKDKNITYK